MTLLAVAAGMGLASCGGASAEAPGQVAATYTLDLFHDHIAAARQLVLPRYRYVVELFGADIGPRSGSTRHIEVGSVSIRGNAATVELTGTVCSTGSPKALTSMTAPGVHCLTNRRRDSTNPAFRVRLVQSSDHWYVTYVTG
ncbi:MAG: hypothetical protein ACYCU7_14210 [Acidimicrobiales bacterium]